MDADAVRNLLAAARRVRAKFGADNAGRPLDWSEWTDVDDACLEVDSALAADVETELQRAAEECLDGLADDDVCVWTYSETPNRDGDRYWTSTTAACLSIHYDTMGDRQPPRFCDCCGRRVEVAKP